MKGDIVVCMKKADSKSRGKMLTVLEFRSQFGEEAQCGEQMGRQRWPGGFSCPRCSGPSRGYMATRQVHVRPLRLPVLGHCGNHLPQDAGPLNWLVLGYLSHGPR